MTTLPSLALVLALTLALPFASPAQHGQPHQHVPGRTHPSPSGYAGIEERGLKVYADEEVRALERGEGMGYALLAELTHYPGPKHALELRTELDLAPAQVERLSDIFDAMETKAVRLGKSLLEKERALQAAFVRGEAGAPATSALVDAIAALEGQLRWTHLEAHVQTRRELTDAQVLRYDELRGYSSSTVGSAPG